MRSFKFFPRTTWIKLIIVVILFMCVSLAIWQYKGIFVRMIGWPFLPKIGPPETGSIRFAVIGDYGSGKLQEGDVARLIKSWDPDFITTLGDNNYPEETSATIANNEEALKIIDKNIGKYYHEYIAGYKGNYGRGSRNIRFFPIPGHRDWDVGKLQPYLRFFTLPGNERYYDFAWGPVHFFMVDTDEREPDGATELSVQGTWLKKKLSESLQPWKLVYVHHAPYTSHRVDDIKRMRWPFKRWGADAVLSGYYHVYERLLVDGIPYFVNGAGGSWVSNFGEIDPHSKFRYNKDYGAMMVQANDTKITFQFINRKGKVVDSYSIERQDRGGRPLR